MASSNFSVIVDTTLSKNSINNLKNEIQKQKYKVKIDLDDSAIKNTIKNLDANIDATLKHANQFKNFTTQLTNDFTKMGESFKNAIVFDKKGASQEGLQYIERYKNALGDVIERTTSLSESYKILDVEEKKLVSGIANITTSTEKSLQMWNGLETKLTQVSKVIRDTDGNEKNIITRTREWVDANNKLHTSVETVEKLGNKEKQLAPITETISTNVAKLNQNLNKFNSQTNNATKNLEKLGNQGQEASKKIKPMGQSFSDIVTKVSKFYLATLPMQAFTRAVSEAKDVVLDFDKAITEMGKVSNYSGEQLKAYTRDLADMGAEVGRTMTEMTEATTGWIKAGYNEEDASRLAQYSALLQNTADEQLESSEATAILVSQLKAYHMEVEDTIKITDILNNVSAKEAVSSGDLAKGLTQASASLATYGNTIEKTTALLTAGTTIFQGKSQQVARGLNQIANRVAKNEKALKAYGVEIYDENNQLRSTYDILVDLSPQWEKMSKAEQVSLGTTLAGTNQYKVLSAVMSQMEIAQRAYGEALDSSGMTMKQNEVYMGSLEAKVKELKAEFEKLVIGDGGLQKLTKALVDIGIAILKLANSDFGKAIIQITLLTTAITKTVSAFEALQASTVATTIATKGFGSALLSLELNPVVLAITALIGVGYGLIKMMNHSNDVLDKNKNKLKEASEEYNKTKEEVDSLERQLESVGKQIDEINKKGTLELTDEQDLRRLKEQEASLERQLQIKKLLEEKQAKEESDRAKEQLQTKTDYAVFGVENALGDRTVQYESMTEYQAIDKQIESIKTLKKDLVDTETELVKYYNIQSEFNKVGADSEAIATKYGMSLGEVQQQILLLEEKQSNLDETINKMDGDLLQMTSDVDEANQKFNATTTEEENLKSSIDKVIDSALNFLGINKDIADETDVTNQELEEENEILSEAEQAIQNLAEAHNVEAEDLKNWAKELGMSESALVDYADAMGLGVEKAYEIQSAFKNMNDSIDSVQSAYGTLTSAIEEYNQTGYYSLDTMQALLSMSPEYLGMLQEENGVLSLNEDAIRAKIVAQAEEAQQTIYNTAIERLNQLAEKDGETSTNAHANAKSNSVGDINAQTTALENNTNSLIKNAQAEALRLGVAKSQADGVIKDMKAQLDIVNKAVKGFGNLSGAMGKNTSATKGNSGAHKGNTSARKENTDAIKEQTEALEKQKKALEDEKKALEDNAQQYADAFEFIEDTMKRHIEDLKDKRDKNLQHLEDRAQKIVGTYQKSNNEVTKVIEDYKKTHEKALDDINDLFKEAEKNYRQDMENILDDWEDFTSRIGNFDEYEKNGAKAFEQTELQQKESRLKEIQRNIDILNEKKAHLGGKEREDIQAQIDAYEEEEAELYKVIGAKKAEQEYNKIVEDTNKKITDLQIKSLQKQKQEISDYYAEKIKQEEKSNETLEEQLKLQEALEKMARAKSNKVMVYKNGSWQYQSSEKDVSSAQETYAEIKRQQEKTAITNQLKEEEAKKIAEIEAKIEELTKQTEKSYEEQIEDAKQYLIDIKAEYDKQEKAYSDKITKRNESYQVELDNLTKKVTAENEQYEKTISKLTTLETKYSNIKKKYEELLPPMEDFLKKVQSIRQEMEGDGKKKKAFEDIFKMDSDKLVANWEEISTQLGKKRDEWKKITDQIQPLEFKIKDLDKTLNNLKSLTTSANNAAGAYERLANAKTSAGFSNGNGNDNDNGKSVVKVFYKSYNDDKNIYDTKDKATQERSKLRLDPKLYPIVEVKDGDKTKYLITAGAVTTTDSIASMQQNKKYVGYNKIADSTNTYASGTASVRGNQVAITGEDPNREIVLGSKANGVLTHIDNGGGVINANGTRTLAGLFNALGQFSSSNFGGSVGTLSSVNKSNSTNISIGNISLPNVQNGKDFVDYLQNFSMSMIQASF